jgi:hypothetical protein
LHICYQQAISFHVFEFFDREQQFVVLTHLVILCFCFCASPSARFRRLRKVESKAIFPFPDTLHSFEARFIQFLYHSLQNPTESTMNGFALSAYLSCPIK